MINGTDHKSGELSKNPWDNQSVRLHHVQQKPKNRDVTSRFDMNSTILAAMLYHVSCPAPDQNFNFHTTSSHFAITITFTYRDEAQI